jgi:D-hydroxyproline dehydrogenase subunit beta
VKQLKIAVVGAGIMGLAQAWSAAKRGHRVTVFERSSRASGGSVRNFGMVWPMGQFHEIAMKSRAAWLELAAATQSPRSRSLKPIWIRACGSIHLAHRPDEWSVLQEFAELAPKKGLDCSLLTPNQVKQRTPAANPQGLLGGLFSPTEICVNPLETIRNLPAWLNELYGVEFHFNTAITSIDNCQAELHDGTKLTFDRWIVCSGTDFSTLFPQSFVQSGLKQCKLQMMKTVPQPEKWDIGTHIASGLTLRYYSCFEVCPSHAGLKQRIASETPELDQYGIHLLASQNDSGGVILGDSHEYDGDIEPFDKQCIDELMMRELRKIIELPNWTIAERWHGYYCKNPTGPVFCAEPMPGVSIRTGAGGSGMTMSFGLAESDWENWN